MSDNLQKYLPEFDEEETRSWLANYSKEDLLDMLVQSYKVSRIFAKMVDEQRSKFSRIQALIEEPSQLSQMPDVPGPDELRKLWDK